MSTTPDKVVQWIIDNYLGRAEPFPPRYGEWIPFQERWGYAAGVEVEWCGGLIMDAVTQTGGRIGSGPGATGPNCWSTIRGARQAIAEGIWVPADGRTGPQRGDWVLFDWQGRGTVRTSAEAGHVDHIELCEDGSAWERDRSFITLAGNVGERCGRFRRHDDATVVGWIRPRYAVAAPAGPPPLPQVGADFQAKVTALAAAGHNMGARTSGERPVFGFGPPAVFHERGVLLRLGGGVVCVRGDIFVRWWSMAEHLGMPVGDEYPGPAPGTQIQRFDKDPGSCLYWSPVHRARFLNGPVGQWVLAGGPEVAALGAAVSDRIVTVPDTGRAARFDGGWAVWSPEAGGVVAVTSPVVEVYEAANGTRGLGFPLSRQADSGGRASQRFTRGTIEVPR